MTSIPLPKDKRASLGDDRGAVVVIGLVLCVLLVGILWYVIGVGNALASRERAQEAADAVAFSTAVGQARGMNTLVLINLILSVVTSIRFVIMVIWTALIALEAILTVCVATLIGAPICGGPLALVTAALSFVTPIKVAQQPVISAAMSGLGMVAEHVTMYGEAVATVTPKFVARGYEPVVTRDGAIVDPAEALPAEEDITGSKLCGQAVEVFQDLVKALFDRIGLGPIGSVIGKLLGIAKKLFKNPVSALFFCGLGGNPPEIDLPPEVSNEVETKCALSDECVAIADAKRELKRACEDRCYQLLTGGTVDAANELAGDAAEKANHALGVDPPANRRVRPANLYGQDEWINGESSAQYVSFLSLNLDEAAKIGTKGVEAGGFGEAKVKDVSKDFTVAFAQAEMYYDCDGAWHDDQCNGGDDALWNFRWRARLRLVNAEADGNLARSGGRSAPGLQSDIDKTVQGFSAKVRSHWTGAGSKVLQDIQSLVAH